GTAWCFHRRLRRRNVAGFNRRMPKTACPVVWEGLRAKSRSPDPIMKPGFLLEFTLSAVEVQE
ncbi:MAG: hypothetical protein NTZ78_07885, partial [Candidatus Aureabacteria bacterium]|nr:hypothetical protein [Candidatus Auribacterota bacterium]